jgi:uroporphyrinogen-III synthase
MATDAASPAVLVTRPEGAASDDLCAAVTDLGFEAHSQPLLTLTALASLDEPARQSVMALDNYEHVIFVSANAVRFGMAQIGDYWPQLPVGLRWYAIGSATAKLLSSYGVQALTPGENMTSEGLLALPELSAVDGARVLLVKGCGGRDKLRLELERRGARVDELACYERGLPALPPGELAERLERWKIAVILLSSGEGLANLQELLRPAETTKFIGTCLIVPSQRVAQQARDAGFTSVIVADNASDASMLHALHTWRLTQGKPAQETKQ